MCSRSLTVAQHRPAKRSVTAERCQHYIATQPRSFLGFGVQSAMGWALGAEAARVAQPDELRPALSAAIDTVRSGTTSVVEVLTRRVKTNLSRG